MGLCEILFSFLFWKLSVFYFKILPFPSNAILSHIKYDIWYIGMRQTPFSQLIRYSRVCSCQHFLDRGLMLTRNPRNQGSYWNWNHHFEIITVATCLTAMEYLQYHKWSWICSTWRIHFPVFSYIQDLPPALYLD